MCQNLLQSHKSHLLMLQVTFTVKKEMIVGASVIVIVVEKDKEESNDIFATVTLINCPLIQLNYM